MHPKLMFPRAIRYLLAVAEHQSFTRAANALYVSQPTLSQQIKQLEETLGVLLLDRSGRTVQLTDAGQVYLTHARRALAELDAAKRAVSEVENMSRGFLRVGMTPITEYLTTSLLEDFSARYPGIKVNAMEMSQDQIEAGVAENSIDVGIAFTHTPATEIWSGKIEIHTMFKEPLSLTVGESHPLCGQQLPVTAAVLGQEALVLLSPNFALRRHVDLYCLEQGITPHIVIETNSLSMIVQSVGLGRLVTVLPTTIACTHSGLYAVPISPKLPNHTIALICSKGAYKSHACRAFGVMASEWDFGRCPVMLKPESRPCPRLEVCKREKTTFVTGEL